MKLFSKNPSFRSPRERDQAQVAQSFVNRFPAMTRADLDRTFSAPTFGRDHWDLTRCKQMSS